jgi:excisionase family DNA binding protein
MKLLSVSEVMERLSVKKEDTVYALIHSRQLAAHRISSKRGGRPRWKVSEEDLRAYLDSIRQAPTAFPPPMPAGQHRPSKRFIDRTLVYA